MVLSDQERELYEKIINLQKKMRKHTYDKYKRINPFFEDICDWKERGEFWTGYNNVTIYNSATICGDVKIGKNSWIGSFVNLDGTGELSIGEYCSISSGVQILSHDTIEWALTGGKANYTYAKTEIGDRCFIGTKAIITKGVHIDCESIVAAGAVVTKSFPKNSIIAGVPAKQIGRVTVEPGTLKIRKIYFE